MVRAISGSSGVPFGACPEDMLEEAITHIEAHFDAVLVRGNMSRSAVVLGRALGLTLPTLPIVNADPAGEDAFEPAQARAQTTAPAQCLGRRPLPPIQRGLLTSSVLSPAT